ncbi:hypothetical protein Mal4_10190 [Maioricimonas rarisocia]|uniref:Uncharacterized protein n=1 Tax=Maioricimonas rarisocia TaxID=2528026 RepID=A0A517Z2K9_9PLAN|nr:hypothetical protein [Maioricimonas rarisocia]QDU36723.1 hypothetical protein Mal4_10190 [Maioricimonas rarisocia]
MSTTNTDASAGDASTEFRLRVVHHRQEVEAAEQSFQEWQAEWKVREQQLEEQLREIESELQRVSGQATPRLRLVSDAGE